MAFRGTLFAAFSLVFSGLVAVSHGRCPKGYYGKTTQTYPHYSCHPCPTSTYKDHYGFDKKCTPCPSHSGHTKLGRITIRDCKCLHGYTGSPETGNPCVVRHCDLLPTPWNGAFKGQCNRQYSSVCVMKCNEGYEGVGSIERRCEVDGNNRMSWSGTTFSCMVIRCPPFYIPYADPPSGVCSGVDLVYKTRCRVSCLRGYRLIGWKEQVCQLDKTWSGSASCEQILCPRLPPVQAGAQLNPPGCTSQQMRMDSMCRFTCPEGFVLQDSLSPHRNILCGADGMWTSNDFKCRDIRPPTLKCPSATLQTDNLKGKATGIVIWSVQVSDNSVDADPNAVIQVRSSHESGQELPIGRTVIKVTATDQAGNKATCHFIAEVKDTESPSCSNCPGDIVREETRTKVRVNWKHPSCSDNSGIPPTIYPSRQSGDLFKVPGTYHIQFRVSDDVNEIIGCSFKITLKVKTCPPFKAPRNGALACTPDGICGFLCSSGTDFDINPPLLYYCESGTAQWSPWLIPGQTYSPNVPNCVSGSSRPSWYKMMNFHDYFYNGDANDPNVQEAIKVKFHTSLQSLYVPPFFCKFQPKCTKDNISVTAGVQG